MEELSIDTFRAVSVRLKNETQENMNVNGSITPVSFKAVPPVGKRWKIQRVLVYLEGNNPFGANTFGDLPALVNGTDNKLNGISVTNWKTNRDMALEMYDLSSPKILAKEDRSFSGRWSFDRAFGNGVMIDAENNGVEIIIRDDLSSLHSFYIVAQGQEL
jgi:hypothetical protein